MAKPHQITQFNYPPSRWKQSTQCISNPGTGVGLSHPHLSSTIVHLATYLVGLISFHNVLSLRLYSIHPESAWRKVGSCQKTEGNQIFTLITGYIGEIEQG